MRLRTEPRRGSLPEKGENVILRGGGHLAESGFEKGGIVALAEGSSKVITDPEAPAL